MDYELKALIVHAQEQRARAASDLLAALVDTVSAVAARLTGKVLSAVHARQAASGHGFDHAALPRA